VEKEVIPVCRQYGIGVLPYFPLAAGLLTGKYRRGQPAPPGTRLAGSPRAARWMNEANFDAVERLERFAADRGISLLDVAIGGMAAKPQIASVIAGATKPEQIEANVRAGMWQPSVQDMEEIDRITGGVDD
jgi:aryl-alcohol dehydrogenase-like predicted oxidoreductase